MLSLHSIAVSETGTPAVDYPSITCYLKKSSDSISIITNSGAERRECTAAIQITQALSGNYTLYVIAPKIRFPQLEKGTSVTDFDAPILEQSLSLILQTADDISLAIINKLGETGINISGNNRSIELRGDKVTFQNSAGTLQSPKIWIEATSGALHADDAVITNATINGLTAQNAEIEGLIATNASVSGVLVTENATMMNKVVIDALTGGIITYGPDLADHFNNDLPAEGAEYGKTVEIGWGTDENNHRYGVIHVYSASDNHPSHGTLIDNEDIFIQKGDNQANLYSTGVDFTSGGSGVSIDVGGVTDFYHYKAWDAIICNKLNIKEIREGSYYAILDTDIIYDVFIVRDSNTETPTAGEFTLFLPDPTLDSTLWIGKKIYVKHIGNGANLQVKIQNNRSRLIDGNDNSATDKFDCDAYSLMFICIDGYWIRWRGDD
jgi:hypothetical protein